MTSIESAEKSPHAFGIFEVAEGNPAGLEPGDYLVTDIPISDWIEEEQNLNSPVRKRLAGWAQQISDGMGEPFSLTCAAQSEAGFAMFRITRGRAEGRDLYWFDPKRDKFPLLDTEKGTFHYILEV